MGELGREYGGRRFGSSIEDDQRAPSKREKVAAVVLCSRLYSLSDMSTCTCHYAVRRLHPCNEIGLRKRKSEPGSPEVIGLPYPQALGIVNHAHADMYVYLRP